MSRPASRIFLARVVRVGPLAPSFVRVTLTGDDLQHFASGGLDQRAKVLFPHPDGSWGGFGICDDPQPPVSEWYPRWRSLADDERNTMRTYTVRAVRPWAAEVDIDVVLHGTAGPASAWALTAASGDQLAIVGADGRAGPPGGGGVEWRPGTARRVLLAGDETAAPAICSIVESLETGIEGLALIEVPTAGDRWPVPTRSGVEVRWLARDGAAHGSLLTAAVHQWGGGPGHPDAGTVELADPDPESVLWDAPAAAERGEYAWLAGEAGVITGLRRHLVRDLGWDRGSVAFMGYWRRGRSEN